MAGKLFGIRPYKIFSCGPPPTARGASGSRTRNRSGWQVICAAATLCAIFKMRTGFHKPTFLCLICSRFPGSTAPRNYPWAPVRYLALLFLFVFAALIARCRASSFFFFVYACEILLLSSSNLALALARACMYRSSGGMYSHFQRPDHLV